MSTYRELVYLILDELKMTSDDSTFNDEHVMFLLSKYRGFILKQQYKDIKKEIPESNYQTVCIDLIPVSAITGIPCEGGEYLRSTKKIPSLMSLVSPSIYPEDYYQGNITLISRDRMKYVGNNRWLQNIIYASIGPDNYLYMKSSNPQYIYLEKVRLTGIFEDPDKASELSCDKENAECDPMDTDFPLEEALIPQVVELVLKELSGYLYKPEDNINNASDDLANISAFLKNLIKDKQSNNSKDSSNSGQE